MRSDIDNEKTQKWSTKCSIDNSKLSEIERTLIHNDKNTNGLGQVLREWTYKESRVQNPVRLDLVMKGSDGVNNAVGNDERSCNFREIKCVKPCIGYSDKSNYSLSADNFCHAGYIHKFVL